MSQGSLLRACRTGIITFAVAVGAHGQAGERVKQLDLPDACVGDLGEPNDTLATAYQVGCNLGLTAKICSSGDLDYYKFVSPYSGSTTISLLSAAGKDYDLLVFNPAQQLVCSSTLPAGTLDTCTVTVAAGATWYLEVYGAAGAFSAADLYVFTRSCIGAPPPPTVSTGPVAALGRTWATLNVSVNPNGADTSVWSDYGRSLPYAQRTGTYGVGQGTSTTVIGTHAPGLQCATGYNYRATARSEGGEVNGINGTFTTAACIPPTVTTGAPTNVEGTRATLNVSVNPNGGDTWVRAEYGPTTAYGTQTGEYGVGYGEATVNVPTNAPNLTCGTLYHYRARARNTAGQEATPGADATFTTPTCPSNLPSVTTQLPGGVGPTRASLRGTVNPNGSNATARFEYGTTPAYGSVTPSVPMGSGTTPVGLRGGVQGLNCGTTYYLRATGTTGAGTATGEPRELTTLPCSGGVGAHDFAPLANIPGLQASSYRLRSDSDGWLYVLAPLASGLGLSRSTDGGASFSSPVPIPNSSFSNVAFALDIDPSDVVHVAWMGDGGGGATESYYVRSTDRGATFSPRVSVRSGQTFNGYRAQNATYPVVASDGWGHVYVAFSGGTQTAGGVFVGYDIWVARSNDFGATFEQEFYTDTPDASQDAPRKIVAGPNDFYVLFVDESAWDLYLHRGSVTGYALNATRINANPGRVQYGSDLAIDETGARLHVAYSDTSLDSEGDLLYCRSIDHGATWSACLRVNDDTYRGQYNPTIRRDGYGTVHVVWTDVRANTQVRSYYAASTDDGATFSPNTNLTAGESGNFEQVQLTLDEANRRLYFTNTRLYSYQLAWSSGTYARNAPTVQTAPATAVTATSALLSASVNPNGSATSAWFDYGTTPAYGSQTPVVAVGAGTTAVTTNATLNGLACGTPYYFRAAAQNAAGLSNAEGLTFTTAPCPPSVVTQSATNVTAAAATLRASVNPNGSATSVFFDYGTTPAFGDSTPPQGIGSGTMATDVSAPATALACATTYHFRAVATNAGGTVPGAPLTFTTAACPPVVTTEPASGVSTTSATLHLTVNPRGALTFAHFEYGIAGQPGSTTPAQNAGSGSVPLALSADLTGLTCDTIYSFRAIATSSAGTAEGLPRTFTTAPCPPTVSTLPATGIAQTGATFNSNVTPNGHPTLAWFEYGTTPAYGTFTLPQDVGSGTSVVAVSRPVSGLRCGTRYYHRAAASNTGGTVQGTGLWFDTSRCPYSKGDLNLDLQTDLVLRHVSTGANSAWLMDGVMRQLDEAVTPNPPAPTWEVAGVDDFSGDGRNDLAFWNSATGAVEFWIMDRTTRVGLPVPLGSATTLPPPWKLSATADFSHDGHPDLVWRNFLTQKIVIWTLDRTDVTGTIVPDPDQAANGNWEIVAALDFNADTHTDLLWYNSTSGRIVLWFMDAAVRKITGMFTNPPQAGDANWKVLAAGDYGIGPAGLPATNDIVWRNATSGRYVVWYMDNAGNKTSGAFTSPDSPANPLEWTIAGPR